MRVTADPGELPAGTPATFTVKAVDAQTGAAVAGHVRIACVDKVLPTNTPVTATLTADTATNTVTAARRLFLRKKPALGGRPHRHGDDIDPADLDDTTDIDFADTSTIERKVSVGSVSAPGYYTAAVFVKVKT